MFLGIWRSKGEAEWAPHNVPRRCWGYQKLFPRSLLAVWVWPQWTFLTIPFPPLFFRRLLRCHHFLKGAPAGAGLPRAIAEDGAAATGGPAARNHSNKAGVRACSQTSSQTSSQGYSIHTVCSTEFSKPGWAPKGDGIEAAHSNWRWVWMQLLLLHKPHSDKKCHHRGQKASLSSQCH